jgi:hypothetical protein
MGLATVIAVLIGGAGRFIFFSWSGMMGSLGSS